MCADFAKLAKCCKILLLFFNVILIENMFKVKDNNLKVCFNLHIVQIKSLDEIERRIQFSLSKQESGSQK